MSGKTEANSGSKASDARTSEIALQTAEVITFLYRRGGAIFCAFHEIAPPSAIVEELALAYISKRKNHQLSMKALKHDLFSFFPGIHLPSKKRIRPNLCPLRHEGMVRDGVMIPGKPGL